MKHIFGLLVLVLMPCIVIAQDPAIQWQKSYGGSTADYVYSMIKTSDSGFAFTGWTLSHDGDASDNQSTRGVSLWVVKLNFSGVLQWHKCFGGKRGDDMGSSIIQTSDGGYIVAGETRDSEISRFKGDYDIWVIRLDSKGNILWNKLYGGSGGDYANAIIQTSDGGFAVAGYTNSSDGDVTGRTYGLDDFWIIKLDSVGVIEWQECYGGSSLDQPSSIIQTFDKGFLVAGLTGSRDHDVSDNNGYDDAWIIKLNSIGHLEWQKCFGGIGYELTSAQSIIQIADSGFIILGTTNAADTIFSGNHGKYDVWVAKLDSHGSTEWLKIYGGSNDDYAASLIHSSDGGYAFAGTTYSGGEGVNHGATDYWVVKLNSSGDMQWQRFLGGTDQDDAASIVQAFDGGYVIGGWSGSKDGDVIGNTGGRNAWIVKLLPVNGVPEFPKLSDAEVFLSPNPSNGIGKISYNLANFSPVKIEVYNALGERLRILLSENEVAGIHEHGFDLSDLSSGKYFFRMQIDGKSVMKGIEIMK